MSNECKMVRLGDVIEQIRGVSYVPSDLSTKLSEQHIVLLRANNIQNEINFDDVQYVSRSKVSIKQHIKKGDILICASSGSKKLVGKAAQSHIDYDACFGAFCKVIRPNNIDYSYLGNYFKSEKYREEISRRARGANINNLKNEDIDTLIIPLPTLGKQQEIAGILNKASECVAKRKKQLAELDLLTESVFYDMFGDPVTNEKEWKKGLIGDVCVSVNYGTSAPSIAKGKYKYLRMNNITYNGDLNLKDLKYIDIEDKNYEKYVVRKGDLLFNRTNSKELVGKTTLIQDEEEMIIAGYIIRVRVNNTMCPIFVARYMNTIFIKQYLRGLCKSIIGQANINAKELQSIPMYFPPLTLQTQFANRIEKIDLQKSQVRKALKESEDLFQRLMQDMFNPEYHKQVRDS